MNTENNGKERREVVPFWRSGFGELDKVFDNFKRDFEHAFTPALQKNISICLKT